MFYKEGYATTFFINAVFSDDNIAWDGFNSGSFVRIKVGFLKTSNWDLVFMEKIGYFYLGGKETLAVELKDVRDRGGRGAAGVGITVLISP